MKRLLLCLTAACAMTAVAADARPAHHRRQTNVINVPPGSIGGALSGARDAANPNGVNGINPGAIGNALGGGTTGMGDVANPSGSTGGGLGDVAGGGMGDVANPSGPVMVGGSHNLYPLPSKRGSVKHGHKIVGLTGTTGKSYGQLPLGSTGDAAGGKRGHSGGHHHVVVPAPHAPGKAPLPMESRASRHPGGAN